MTCDPSTPTIREATQQDAAAIARLAEDAGMGTLTPRGTSYVALDGNRIVGFIRIVEAEGDRYVSPIVVDPQARRLGVGRARSGRMPCAANRRRPSLCGRDSRHAAHRAGRPRRKPHDEAHARLPFDHRRPCRHPRGHLHARPSPGLVFLAAQGHRVRHPRHHHQARWHGLLGAGYRRGGMDDEAREWLHEKRAEADAALANIDQRRQTLHRFGVYLAEVQYDFFMGGEARMRPLTMQQAADALGVHVSTISRTVQDKYALTPWGVFPLKHFFSSSVACTAEERRHALSSLAIKDLVAQEDRRTPLSDATITAILNGEGVDIKRRTVAKYREALGIGRQSQRRR